MENSGYIKVYRSLKDKGYWKDSEYVHLWIHLLMKASYREIEYLFNNKIHHLQPGQFITGRKTLVNETGINRSKVERILKCFENEQQIEQQTNNKFRIITILNWDKYQISEQQNEQPVSNQRAASEQPVSTINKEKNIKNKTYSEDFLKFYTAYPNRKDKDEAYRSWCKRNGSRPPIDVLLSAIEKQKKWRENAKPEDFRPQWKNPATWLNKGSWEDECDLFTANDPFKGAI